VTDSTGENAYKVSFDLTEAFR